MIGGVDHPLRLCLNQTQTRRSAMSVFLAWLQMVISQGKVRGMESQGRGILLRVDLPAGFASEVTFIFALLSRGSLTSVSVTFSMVSLFPSIFIGLIWRD